jgi:hypothetical protein
MKTGKKGGEVTRLFGPIWDHFTDDNDTDTAVSRFRA